MASFGGYAGHERRGSGVVPLRSAVLGLVGAALGVDRSDMEGQEALRAYGVAVQSLRDSRPLRDYHTVETVPTAKARRPVTRRDALARAGRGVNTIITKRDYRSDVLIGIALWGDGRWTLDEVAAGFERPHFPLYLGRKSCPLASPVNAKKVTKDGPVQALACIEVPSWLDPNHRVGSAGMKNPIYSDPVADVADPVAIELVPGEPLNRQTWTFGDSAVWLLSDQQGSQMEGENS